MQLPLFEPESSWTPPTHFPELDECNLVAIDTETKDPTLLTSGPGASRGLSYPVGISIATDTGFSGYYPFKHDGGGNFDRDTVLSYFRRLLSRRNLGVVFCNDIYDLEVLRSVGVEVKSQLHDIKVAECLLDEESPMGYSLNALCAKYDVKQKDDAGLIAAAKAFGLDPKADLWRLHSKYVGEYAEGDAVKTLQVFQKQLPQLKEQELMRAYALEMGLAPILLNMRFTGVPFSEERAREGMEQLLAEENGIILKIRQDYGVLVNPWSTDDLVKVCHKHKIRYGVTNNGAPSFTKDFLLKSNNPFLVLISNYREINKIRRDFLESALDKFCFNGRIYATFHRVRSYDESSGEESGTRQRRFSSSKPNLQQIPKRSKYANLVRRCFIPESGAEWSKFDYSQQEPRLCLHFAFKANCSGATETRERLVYGNQDFYTILSDSIGRDRQTAKQAFLANMYRQSAGGFARTTGLSEDRASEILFELNAKEPWIREVSDLALKVAKQKGYVKTILGARRRFNLYVPYNSYDIWQDSGRKPTPLPHAKACEAYGKEVIVRHGTSKALNSVVQGSGGDINKVAMLNVFLKLGIPLYIPVHDELNYPTTSMAEHNEIKKIIESALEDELTIPMKVDDRRGESWGK